LVCGGTKTRRCLILWQVNDMSKDEIITAHYKEHANNLVRYFASRNHNNTMDGEDIVHTAYWRAVRYYHLYESSGITFVKWFNSILTNVYRDFLKTKFGQVVVEDIDDIYIEPEEDATLDFTFNMGIIIKAIEKLPPRHQKILKLFYVYQYGLMDISRILPDVTYKQADNTTMAFKRLLIGV